MRRHYVFAGGSGIVLLDRFTDTNGVRLNAHTMDAGPGWTEHSGNWQVQSNRAEEQTAGGVAYLATANGGIATGTASLDLVLPAAGSWDAGLVVRFTDTDNHWVALLEHPGGGRVTLVEVNGGVATGRGNAGGLNIAGTTVTVEAVCAGSTIAVSVNGVERVRYASATHSQGGTRWGLRNYRDGSFQAVPMDNFQVRR